MSKNNAFIDNISVKQMFGLMLLAYAFSFAIRMIWVWQFKDASSFYWNDELMINTNDGYFFASGVQQALSGLHESNPRVFGWLEYGVIFFTTLLVKFTPMSIETAILYMPSIVSSLVVIPIILITRLYNQTLWGFFSALLGSIAWSYYNRTMTGYYDTDMFSAMAPMFILFFLMKSTIDFNLKTALYAGLSIVIYPFLYDSGLSIVYAMGMTYALYMLFFHRNDKVTYASLILIFIALTPFGLSSPTEYVFKLALLILVYLGLSVKDFKKQELMLASILLFVLFLIFGDVFTLIWNKVSSYVITGTEEGALQFYAVNQTVREAGQIPFSMFANRISGSEAGLLVALVGYIVLVVRHRAFILALPLVGIGTFALFGGLRFTVYAVPIAGMSAIYLFFVMAEYIEEIKIKYAFITVATIAIITPNILHIIEYKVQTVLNKTEVQDLVKLDEISEDKDYTLSWWDYGYPIWYYSSTNTLIDGGKHNHDNYIISKLMFSTSPTQVANLSRVAVETYIDSNYSIVADRLFGNKINPETLLEDLKKPAYLLPEKTRDVYLYMPFRMMRIFPTVGMFGNLNLKTGKPLRRIKFYSSSVANQQGGRIVLENGIVLDINKGLIELGRSVQKIQSIDMVEYRPEGKSVVQSELKHLDGDYGVIFMKSYGTVVVVDKETYNSAFVQMFILDKHDINLFELVVSSPYSKIYRIQR